MLPQQPSHMMQPECHRGHANFDPHLLQSRENDHDSWQSGDRESETIVTSDTFIDLSEINTDLVQVLQLPAQYNGQMLSENTNGWTKESTILGTLHSFRPVALCLFGGWLQSFSGVTPVIFTVPVHISFIFKLLADNFKINYTWPQ